MAQATTAETTIGKDGSANPPAQLANVLSTGLVTRGGHLYVQNQSAAQVQLVLNSDQATPTIIVIDPAASGLANSQGGDFQLSSNIPFFVGRFQVRAASAAAQVAVIYR